MHLFLLHPVYVCIFQKYKYTTYFVVSHVPKKNHKKTCFFSRQMSFI
jgi:hypothetical protein